MGVIQRVTHSFLVASFLLAFHPLAAAVEIMRWERIPLAVPLIVGQERIIFLDQDVRVGVPNSIKESLRVQSANGAIYLLASQDIEPTRLQLQSMHTGEIILLDIAATEAKKGAEPLEPVKVVRGRSNATQDAASAEQTADISPNAPVEAEIPKRRPTPVPVVLTRYAAQNMYAPLRTVEPVSGISPVTISTRLDLSTLMPSQPVQAVPLAAWRLDGYWVTAVRLTNVSPSLVSLDPRELQGNFLTATFQHNYLGQRGEPTDTTVVYLVTRGGDLSKALLPVLSQVDASSNTAHGGAK